MQEIYRDHLQIIQQPVLVLENVKCVHYRFHIFSRGYGSNSNFRFILFFYPIFILFMPGVPLCINCVLLLQKALSSIVYRNSVPYTVYTVHIKNVPFHHTCKCICNNVLAQGYFLYSSQPPDSRVL